MLDRAVQATGAIWASVEERFAATLSPGDTFFFAGLSLEVEQLKDMDVIVRAAKKSRHNPELRRCSACR